MQTLVLFITFAVKIKLYKNYLTSSHQTKAPVAQLD